MSLKISRRAIQRRFANKSLPISLTLLFTGLIWVLTTISAPIVVVFAANIDGTSGNDTLNGTPEADTINGFEGNDLISGEGGDDTLDGGKGDDEIRGGEGIDQIRDGNGDPLTGDADQGNKLYGGSGGDNINAGIDYTRTDYYYIYGEDGADYIKVVSNAHVEGGIDDDTIYCTGYECIINGNEGNDEIYVQLYDISGVTNGGSGDDNLFGKGYNVNGDGGNDYISMDWALDLKGGEGNDVLEATSSVGGSYFNGGSGADTFNCSPGSDDIVEDYNPTEGDTVSSHCEIVQGTTPPPQDTTPPNVEIAQAVDNRNRQISDGATTTSRYIEITFEATDAVGIDKIECSLDGQEFTSCESPVTYDKLRRGSHEVTVRATDAAGNTGEDEFSWTVGNPSAATAPGRQ